MNKRALRWTSILAMALGTGVTAAACSSSDSDPGAATGGASGGGGESGGTDGSAAGSGGAAGTAGAAGGTGGAAGMAGAAGGAAGAAGGGGCTLITPQNVVAVEYNEIVASFSPSLGWDTYDDRISIVMRDGPEPQTVGSIDVSEWPQDNYLTCSRCIVVYEDYGTGPTMRTYFQRSGTIELTTVHDPVDGRFTGSLKDVELEEVTIEHLAAGYTSTPVPGGGCIRIADWSFDTDSTGDACDTGSDCDTLTCDPASLTCSTGCHWDGECNAANQGRCIFQSQGAKYGACYDGCDPSNPGDTCGSGECINDSSDFTTGYCKAAGTKGLHEPCSTELAATTDCAAGTVCGADGWTYECLEKCSFFGASASCSGTNEYCSWANTCLPGPVSDIGIGEPCSTLDQPCAPDNGIARGVCTAMASDPALKCRRVCRKYGMFNDCDANTGCQPAGMGVVGLCGKPTPITD